MTDHDAKFWAWKCGLREAECEELAERIRDTDKRIRALRVYGDEEIAARRGPMEGWVRIDDVLAALQPNPTEAD